MNKLKTLLFAQIVKRISGRKNAYQVQKMFTPDKFDRNKDGGTDYPKMWVRYLKGIGTPNETTLRITEIKIPGTRKWFDMPFWEIIEKDTLPQRHLKTLVFKFDEADDLLSYITAEESTLSNIILATDNLETRVEEEIKLFESPDVISALALLMLNAEVLNNTDQKLYLLKSLFDYIENCLVVYGEDIVFFNLIDLCIKRFLISNIDKEKFEKQYLGVSIDERKQIAKEQIKLKKQIVEILILIGRGRDFVNQFIVLHKYDELPKSTKEVNLRVFNTDDEQFMGIINNLLISVFKPSSQIPKNGFDH